MISLTRRHRNSRIEEIEGDSANSRKAERSCTAAAFVIQRPDQVAENFQRGLMLRLRNESSNLPAVANEHDLFLIMLDFIQRLAESACDFTDGERFHATKPIRWPRCWQKVFQA